VSAPVVAARLRALWRRARPPRRRPSTHLSFGPPVAAPARAARAARSRRIGLTECEFEVLWLLAAQAGPGRVAGRAAGAPARPAVPAHRPLDRFARLPHPRQAARQRRAGPAHPRPCATAATCSHQRAGENR
jgi:hypothetical protein